MNKIICYIPDSAPDSEKKKARNKLMEFEKAGYTVEELKSLDTILSVNDTFKVKVSCDVLNVRQNPHTTSKIVTKIKRKEVYTIIEERNGWGRLKSGVGWIYLKYTERIS